MQCDLSVRWPAVPQASKGGKGKQKASETEEAAPLSLLTSVEAIEVERCVHQAAQFGYSCIALDLVVPPNCFDPHSLRRLNPTRDSKPPWPEIDPRTPERKRRRIDPASQTLDDGLLQLSRVTFVLDESCASGKGNGLAFATSHASTLATFDLVAVRPVDAGAFNHACINLSVPGPSGIDIVSIDFAAQNRLPFQLKRTPILKAIGDGVVFEIAYSAAMRTNGEVVKDARKNLLAGARELIRVTGGKGVIFSSDARQFLELRAPADLQNLGAILGLKPDQAKAALCGNAQAVIKRAHSARQAYRSAVSKPVVIVSSLKRKRDDDAPVDPPADAMPVDPSVQATVMTA